MGKLYLMTTIVDRKTARKYQELYRESGQNVMFSSLGFGTAASEVLNYLGLEATEKAVLFSVQEEEHWQTVKKQLQKKLRIDAPGGGIAFIIPLSSIGGKKALQYVTMEQEVVIEEESTLKDTDFELLITIANGGHIETVMDAARSAHAPGGTVVHAKGTGMEQAKRFLGISLAEEKEMIFIVVRSKHKNEIMRAIMEKAGTGSPAGGIVFSLPVTATAGLRLLEEED